MNPDPALASPPRATPPSDPALLDAAWALRSSEELRQLVQHGLMDGASFEAARELERRARHGTEQTEHAVEVEKADQRTFARYLVWGLTLIGLMGLILGLFVI